MSIRHQVRYDASPEDVYAMLSDPVFRERVCAAMDSVSHDIAVSRHDVGMSVRIDMVQRTNAMPAFARKVVGDQIRIVQSERWDTARGADLELEIPGQPGHVRGRITLSGDRSGTVESFEGEAKVGIPLVGGKLEGLIGKLFVEGMDAERAVGAAWLAAER
jgi:uncharacterized protein YndB with AHSA1/START domain